ncbi:MAG: zinc-binding dehydrogenase, partial [Gammaproteobacteria bacterium]|nr:zinc-binding dehydrogenase [Gammaproteobacteria bacterium]
GKLKPLVSTTLPLSQAARAHRLIEAGHVQGKVVLSV